MKKGGGRRRRKVAIPAVETEITVRGHESATEITVRGHKSANR